MGKQKYSLRVELDPRVAKQIRQKALRHEIKLSVLVRIFLTAWLRGDERAEGIVLDWEAAQMRKVGKYDS